MKKIVEHAIQVPFYASMKQNASARPGSVMDVMIVVIGQMNKIVHAKLVLKNAQ